MSSIPNPALPTGSWVFRNWHAQRSGLPEEFAEEIQIFSDSRFTGELRTDLGPYLLLNTVPEPHEPGELVPALVLRVSAHLSDDTPQVVEAFRKGVPDANAFTGGTTYDEFASLVSLAHRVRLVVGAPTRWFYKHDTDARGSPRYSKRAMPAIPQGRPGNVVPGLTRTTALDPYLLSSYPDIPWASARELARAARSYRQAVWLANSDGNLCWLFLVSAAETAANEWARLRAEPSLSPADLLRSLRPDYVERLETAAGSKAPEVLREVGETQNTVLRAQWKFREFLLNFGLEPPRPRPTSWPIDWTSRSMKQILEVIYRYRSEALHASKPFPLPMSESPIATDDGAGNRTWSEHPGGAVYQSGGLWSADQLPINLYAFHHLVATALLSWWKTLIPNSR
jgi:hypothetical protein